MFLSPAGTVSALARSSTVGVGVTAGPTGTGAGATLADPLDTSAPATPSPIVPLRISTGGAAAPPARRPVTRDGPPHDPAATLLGGCSYDAGGERYLLRLLDAHRATMDVAPLAYNATLSVVARQHSCDMFLHDRLDHAGSGGSSPFERFAALGISYTVAGENIGMAAGYTLDGAIDAIDARMMAEPATMGTHHWNIVNPAFTRVGVGVVDARGQVWLTEDFVG